MSTYIFASMHPEVFDLSPAFFPVLSFPGDLELTVRQDWINQRAFETIELVLDILQDLCGKTHFYYAFILLSASMQDK